MSASRLTAEHAAVLAAMLDRLIPADEHGPGARAADARRGAGDEADSRGGAHRALGALWVAEIIRQDPIER